MAEKKADKPNQRRTQVKELPKQEKELGKDEQRKIKGGPISSGWLPGSKPTSGG
ncbi:MAG TPA: hypothetical protein VGV38_22015 [Pyrinomonadaceae bacterium]|nr:hypothetical protein [Pyrinomonadaceae bacterium]